MTEPIPVSSVPAVKTYLVNAITTQVTAANITEPVCEVYNGQPDHVTTADTIVIAGAHRTLSTEALVGDGGPLWLDETYRVQVEIDCYQAGADEAQDAVQQRAYQLLALVETAVRLDPSLGGLVQIARPEESADTPSWDENGQGARCEITAEIYVYNSL